MRYEIYLRSADSPPDLATRILDDLGSESDVAPRSQGGWEFSGESGNVVVTLHPEGDPRWEGDEGDGARPLGVDLSIAGGAGEALAGQLVELVFEWAARWSLEVYDPQLGRTVSQDEPETITARVKQHSDYLTETVGLGEQSTRHMDVDVDVVGVSLRSKFYFGLAASLLVLGLLAHYCN